MPRKCNPVSVLILAAACAAVTGLMASEHHGVIKSGGLPVPGATVTATKGDKKIVTTTDGNGAYSFPNLDDGVWSMQVSMLGFAKAEKEIGVLAGAAGAEWDLKLLSLAELQASVKPQAPPRVEQTQTPAPNVQASGGRGGRSGSRRPSLQQAAQGRGQTGFQRVDVNESGNLSAAGTDGAISNEAAADLSTSANDSLLVNGSVSRGLGLQDQPDWFGGRGGMGMMGMGLGMGPGLGPGTGRGMGVDADGNPTGLLGPNGDGIQMPGGTQAGGRGGPGGPGGGRGAAAAAIIAGRGGFDGPGGAGPGAGAGGFGGRGGGFGGRGLEGGRGGRSGRGIASFGNARRNPRMRYNTNLGFVLDNSVWDAQSYSVTGNQVQRPAYANATATAMIGGPLKIPHLLSGERGMFTLNYQVRRSRNGTTQNGTMPTALERAGDFSQSFAQGPVTVFDPATGNPFPGNVIPRDRISPIALGLVKYYPLPNFPTLARNYSTAINRVNNSYNVNARVNQTISRRDRISGGIAYQDGDNTAPNLFGFLDTGASRAMNVNVNYSHNFSSRIINSLGFTFSRNRNLNSPYFSFVQDVGTELGITGASPNPINWGPPNLQFTNFTGLSDGSASLTRNQTSAINESLSWVHGLHNFQFGASYRRQQFNPLSDSNARGTFTFTGSATSRIVNDVAVQGTGFDFADFLLGLPNASSINYGNADKYFRTSTFSAYFNDDWRISTKFTLNGGVRWDYSTPVTELYNRLVNLDVAPGFTAVAPVLPGGVGPLTGMRYPESLVRPDRNNFSPRIGFAWRPSAKRSTRINGGYGLYFNNGAYQQLASNMAAQPPFAQNYALATSAENPLSITTFQIGQNLVTNTRAIDPNYIIGYAQVWQLAVQNNFGRGLVGTVTFNHTKGTHLDQQLLPNSLPPGSKAATAGPAGYIYQQTNGNSVFDSVQFSLNRRFSSGIASSVSYMWSKAIDNGGIGTLIAQDWTNLSLERGLSSFDARHTVNATWQYSSGTGRRGGALMTGWKGRLLKDWTFMNRITVRSGTPLTPTVGGNRAVVGGTGVSGPIRADATGLALEPATPGYGFNINAFAAPAAGQWGTSGRNVIRGPMLFSLDGSLGRAFQIAERKNLDLRFDVTNALNRVTITNWGTTLNSSTFGLPTTAATMRRINASLRFRF